MIRLSIKYVLYNGDTGFNVNKKLKLWRLKHQGMGGEKVY